MEAYKAEEDVIINKNAHKYKSLAVLLHCKGLEKSLELVNMYSWRIFTGSHPHCKPPF